MCYCIQIVEGALASCTHSDLQHTATDIVLDTDASKCGMGVVLSQNQEGQTRVIAYASRVFSKAERNYSTCDRGLLDCLFFIEHFHHHLLGRKFLLRTDHTALKGLLSSREPSGRRARWTEKLSEYNFEIIHLPGSQCSNADALSRDPNFRGHTQDASPLESVTDQQDAPPLESIPDQQDSSLLELAPDPLAAPILVLLITVQPPFELLFHKDIIICSAQLEDTEISKVLQWFGNGALVRPPEEKLSTASHDLRRFATELDSFTVVDSILWQRQETAHYTSPRLVTLLSFFI